MRSRTNAQVVSKHRVFADFEKICNQEGASGFLNLKQDSRLVIAVDFVLQHGLREYVRGYWSLMRSFTHSTTLKSLEAFVKYISSSHQKGLVWTFYTLEEGSFEYYLTSLIQDTETLGQHYLDHSLLRDQGLSQRVVATITQLRSEAVNMQSMESSLLSESPLVESTPYPSLPSQVDCGLASHSDTSSSSTEKDENVIKTQLYRKTCVGSSFEAYATSSNNTSLDSEVNAAAINHNQSSSTNLKTKSSILSLNNNNNGVCWRTKKKKRSEPEKRVSFHEDSIDDSDVVMRPRHSNINRFYVEGRYSWAGEREMLETEFKSFRPFKSEIYENKGLSTGTSIFDSEMAIEADCDSSTTALDETKNNIEMVCEKLTRVVKQRLGLKTREVENAAGSVRSDVDWQKMVLAERGVPEGQEDPVEPSECEHSLPARSASDSEWSLDNSDKLIKKTTPCQPAFQRSTPIYHSWSSRVLHEKPSKTSLVKRFLYSIPPRKIYKEKRHPRKSNLYIQGAKVIPELSQELVKELYEEIQQNKPLVKNEENEIVTDEMQSALKNMVFVNDTEKVYKVYRVASTEGVPLLAVLSDQALYTTALNSKHMYSRRNHISYQTLDTVLIGPEYQTVMFVTVDHSVTVTVISALGRALVMDMISHLAVAVTRATHSHLSVFILSLSYMRALHKAVLTQSTVSKDEQLIYYRYIRVEDSHMTGSCSALGPTKTGDLMYRSHNHAPWLPGYIVLKGGILSVFDDAKQQRPKHVLSFHNGYFGGCRRVFNSNRPYAFEILPFSQRGLYGTFQFAAADDYEASDWLQMFIQTSYSMCEPEKLSGDPLLGCGLLLTSQHLLTLDFPDKVVSCVKLQDITTIRTATTCCILETSCREVQTNGGDWILYFLSEQATLEFLDTVYNLKPEMKRVVVNKWESEALLSHCTRTSQQVVSAWNLLLKPLHTKHQLE